MKRAITILFWAHLLAIPFGMWVQEETEVPWYLRENVWKDTGNDNPRGTTSLGMPLNAPLSPIAQHVSWGLGLSVGAGYNFTRRHALVGDFLWNWLYPTNQTVRPIQIALHTNKVSGHGNLFAFTGGYKLELRGKALELTLLLVADGTTGPPAFQGQFRMAQASVAFLLGLTGDTTVHRDS